MQQIATTVWRFASGPSSPIRAAEASARPHLPPSAIWFGQQGLPPIGMTGRLEQLFTTIAIPR